MKKVIRLTESELNNIIKKVISEQTTYRTGNLANPEDFLPGKSSAKPAFDMPRPDINPLPLPAQRPTGTSEPTSAAKTIFGIGDKGPEVKAFQKHLQALGYNVGKNGADGIFGPATEAAVKEFQGKYGIKVSGKVGPPTKGKLAMVASGSKQEFNPTAEWNQDRREGKFEPPLSLTAAATSQKPAPQKKSNISPLITTSPLGQAMGKMSDKAKASREARSMAQAEYQKTHPGAGYGGGGLFGKKGM